MKPVGIIIGVKTAEGVHMQGSVKAQINQKPYNFRTD